MLFRDGLTQGSIMPVVPSGCQGNEPVTGRSSGQSSQSNS